MTGKDNQTEGCTSEAEGPIEELAEEARRIVAECDRKARVACVVADAALVITLALMLANLVVAWASLGAESLSVDAASKLMSVLWMAQAFSLLTAGWMRERAKRYDIAAESLLTYVKLRLACEMAMTEPDGGEEGRDTRMEMLRRLLQP